MVFVAERASRGTAAWSEERGHPSTPRRAHMSSPLQSRSYIAGPFVLLRVTGLTSRRVLASLVKARTSCTLADTVAIPSGGGRLGITCLLRIYRRRLVGLSFPSSDCVAYERNVSSP